MRWERGLVVGLVLLGACARPAAGQGTASVTAGPPAAPANTGGSQTIVVDVAERHVSVPEWRGAATVEAATPDGGGVAVRVGMAAEARQVDGTLRGVHGEVRLSTAAADLLERLRPGRAVPEGAPAEMPMP